MLFFAKTLLFIDVLIAAALMLFRWALVPEWRGLVSAKIVAIALGTPAVALFCGSVQLFLLYLVVMVAFNARSRAELAGVYLLMLPTLPMLAFELGVGSLYLFGGSTAVAMGLGALIGFLVTGRRGTLVLARYDLALGAIVLLFLFLYHRDFSPTGLLRGLALYVFSFAGPYLLVSRAARDAVDIERLLLRLCGGATVMAVTACFQARRHWVLFEAYQQALHVPAPSAATALRAGMLRTGGSMVDYSAGGLFLAAAVTLLPLLRRRFRPTGYRVMQVLLTAGLIVTQSRGAWVAAIVGLVFIAAWRGKWGRVLLIAGGAVAAEMAVLLFAKSGPLASILGKTDEASGNVTYRHQLATRGMEQVRSHPLLGQSPEQLVNNLADLTQGQHIVDFVNSHLFIAMAAGLPLFGVWCWVWAMPVVEGWRRRGGGDVLAAAPAAIIVPVMTALTFTSIVDRNLTWPTIALALAPACFAAARRSAAAPASRASPRRRTEVLVARIPAAALTDA